MPHLSCWHKRLDGTFHYCVYEDVDLSFRGQFADYKCLYTPTAIVYHKVGGTSGTENDFTLYYGQRNIECVYLKLSPLKCVQ